MSQVDGWEHLSIDQLIRLIQELITPVIDGKNRIIKKVHEVDGLLQCKPARHSFIRPVHTQRLLT